MIFVFSSTVVVVSIIPFGSKHILAMLDLILSCLSVLLFGRLYIAHHFVNHTNTLDCSSARYINDKSVLTKHQMSTLNYFPQLLSMILYDINSIRTTLSAWILIDVRNII